MRRCALFPFGQQEMEITYYVCVTVLHLWEKFLPCRNAYMKGYAIVIFGITFTSVAIVLGP